MGSQSGSAKFFKQVDLTDEPPGAVDDVASLFGWSMALFVWSSVFVVVVVLIRSDASRYSHRQIGDNNKNRTGFFGS